MGIRVFIVGYEMECEKSHFSKTGCFGKSLRDWDESWVLVASYQTKPDYTFFPVVIQLSWHFNFLHTSLVCFILASHHSRVSHEFQSWVTFLLHTLDQIFTLSHTQPLHYSHLNTRFLNAELQANLAQNKGNTKLNKFNFTRVIRSSWR